ncbi:conjugative transfer relaxase/helicase TraI [Legionella saoudiensis]|uniref:conjugative transfer relaxase/helicase TraI n=1 Tax=Legionella saoudiensis TaxID=1750561 RepID=UPI001E2977FA|nr:conjugative transfer relaxase/helicase TraI [Legionella saoudiensis]
MMLSLRVQPIKKASYYYDKENYYFSNQLTTEWVGFSAEKQNLSGEVEVQTLEQLVGGVLPSGDVIGFQTHQGEIKHRGGYDLTFSAPKSVSYLGLVAGHKEFIDLHLNAVKTVLKVIEKEAAQARKTGKSGVEYEHTGNLCFATILHDTSRELDPQLHVHALMMNFTERLDGKWRALASDISRNHGTMEWIMNNQILLGLIYRSEIALGLNEMGLEIESTGDAHGLFEIKHFDKGLLECLSKRRGQVKEEVKGMRSSSLKAYDRATLDSRKEKTVVSPEALRERWTNESNVFGIDPSSYFSQLKEKTAQSRSVKDSQVSSDELGMNVMYAIKHLEEKKLSFTHHELLQTSLYFSMGEHNFETLLAQIDNVLKEKKIIPLNEEDTRFTTPDLIKKEHELLNRINQFPSQKKAIHWGKEKEGGNEHIQKVVTEALSSKDSLVRIRQQSALSREVLSTLIDCAEESKKVRILSPTALTSQNINQEFTKRPSTLWQWVLSIGKEDLCDTVSGFNYRHESEHRLPFFNSKKERELLIVDDSQRLSPDDLNKLLSIAEQRLAKVVFLEKSQSITGFKSDIPELLDKAQMNTIDVNDRPLRQTNITLVEARKKEDRILKTAQLYQSLTSTQRKNTQILTHSKLEANEVNQSIRTQLKEHGELSKEERIISILTPISLTESEKKMAKSYQEGMILIQKTRSVSQKLKVIGVNEQANQLIIRNAHGMKSMISTNKLSKTTQIYEPTQMPVAIGEKLVATGNLALEGIRLGAQYEVSEFTPHGIKIKSGKDTIHLDLDTEKHFPMNYAYTKTIYAHDFKSTDRIIATMPAYSLRQNIVSLLSESSKEELHIVTDDVDKANRYAQKASPKQTAISLTLEAAQRHHGALVLDNASSKQLIMALEDALTRLSLEKPIKEDSEKALAFAIAHLGEREAAFKRSELLEAAIHKVIGRVDYKELNEKLDYLLEKGELIAGGNDFLTTKEAVFFEESIISTVKSGINSVKPLITEEDARKQLVSAQLTKGQKEACELITTSPDQFNMIQGYAGTGKTTMTKTAIDTIQYAISMVKEEMQIIAVAPTHQAVKEMRALGIESQTLKSFLIAQEQEPTLSSNVLVLLDESSMVSNRDCASLVQVIKDSGARCTLLGDVSQHQSIESGKPSKLMMQEGSIRVACMDDIVRQQVIEYKNAVETLIQGDPEKALAQLSALPRDLIERKDTNSPYHELTSSLVVTNESLDNRLSAVQKGEDREEGLNDNKCLKMAVGDYLSRTDKVRDKTIVIIHENKKRELANNLIREALIQEKTLGAENISFPRLLSTNYTTAELYFCETYQECLNKGTFYLKREGEYFKVTSIDESKKVVLLEDLKGNKSFFVPEKENKDWKIELFQSAPAKISVGEKIHFKKSDKSLERFANERLQVTQAKEGAIVVKDSSGSEHHLSKDDMKDAHWDYSYTATSYSIQGASSPFVIGVAETGNDKVNHFRSFYIMVTRGSLHAMLYTDDRNKLQAQLRVTPEKTSALEALNRINPNIKTSTKEVQNSPRKSQNIRQSKPVKLASRPYYDANIISQNLSNHAEVILENLLGQPNRELSSKKEYRYGTYGSLVICLHGDKRGVWYNHETLEKGNLLHLIQKTLNLDFKQSLSYAAKLTGDDLKEQLKERGNRQYEPKEIKKSEPNKTQDYALQLARESKPINGTLAEKYLTEIRGIHHVSGDNLRYHPGVFTKKTEAEQHKPALLYLSRDKGNKVTAVEAVYLDKLTGNKASLGIKSKRSYGDKNGSGVILNKGEKDSVTYLAEGGETALSVRDAVPNERVITTLGKGNFKTIHMDLLTDKVVLCLDNDGKPIGKDKVIIEAIERLKNHGKSVKIVIPQREKDFNDISKLRGIPGVVEALSKAVSIDKFMSNTNKIEVTSEKIAECLESISSKLNLEIPKEKTMSIDKIKTLQREEMQIY